MKGRISGLHWAWGCLWAEPGWSRMLGRVLVIRKCGWRSGGISGTDDRGHDRVRPGALLPLHSEAGMGWHCEQGHLFFPLSLRRLRKWAGREKSPWLKRDGELGHGRQCMGSGEQARLGTQSLHQTGISHISSRVAGSSLYKKA